MIVNGKEYPLWSQFVEKQDEWIGGILEDFGDLLDNAIFGDAHHQTVITGIELRPNGDDSAFFEVNGKDFSCGFDVRHGGISGDQDSPDWLCFSGYGGHKWRIRKKSEVEE